MTFYAPLYRSIITAAGCLHVQCSLRVGLTVFIPESDTGAVMMIMVVDLYHDVCVSVSSRWLLISGFSRSHCPRLSKETFLKIGVILITLSPTKQNQTALKFQRRQILEQILADFHRQHDELEGFKKTADDT